MHTQGLEYHEDDYLQLSGLQHFIFCRRQWALIHIEGQWADNILTVSGNLMHSRAHSEATTEKRKNIVITRGMALSSRTLGISGRCDVLEFHQDSGGIPIFGWEGTWIPFPVEYKNGEPKADNCDAAQLCAQAMCLEEMLCCSIREGALFYGKNKRRLLVHFSDALRSEVKNALAEMHALFSRGYTPRVKPSRICNSCSLQELCLPVIMKKRSVAAYLGESM